MTTEPQSPVAPLSAPTDADAVSPGPRFADLGLAPEVLRAVTTAGYEVPTPIQARTIPAVLAGRDVLGQAETGSGKTAAFAMPLLSRLDTASNALQVLVLVPTRELAIQVTAAVEGYARHLPGFRAVTVYGGAPFDRQLKALKRGVHVVVGTPGRVMDHMRRGTLKLDALHCLVLDEADEMLRMGFVDDVEWVLEHIPSTRQILLFSATMPDAIRRIAHQHLRNPEQVKVQGRSATADNIRQRHIVCAMHEKRRTLARILESEETDGVIVFVRTRHNTVELAEHLAQDGFTVAALNGDMPQSVRERTVDHFRRNRLDVLVATDVAARGLDVERVSHVVNYDFPHDAEAYVHRIGRTGRAGRAGEAILFVGPREKYRLGRLEQALKGDAGPQHIASMAAPTPAQVQRRRVARFKEAVAALAADEEANLGSYETLVTELVDGQGLSPTRVAAALAKMAAGTSPLFANAAPERARDGQGGRKLEPRTDRQPRSAPAGPATGRVWYRLEVGEDHGIEARNIVGAITNETSLSGDDIGKVTVYADHSVIDVPDGLQGDFFNAMREAFLAGQRLRVKLVHPAPPVAGRKEPTANGADRNGGEKSAASAPLPRKFKTGNFKGGNPSAGSSTGSSSGKGAEARPRRNGSAPGGPGRKRRSNADQSRPQSRGGRPAGGRRRTP